MIPKLETTIEVVCGEWGSTYFYEGDMDFKMSEIGCWLIESMLVI